MENMTWECYSTKLAPKTSAEECRAANILSDGRVIDKMIAYKEKDEQRVDFGKYKLYAQVDDQQAPTPMTKEDQDALFGRVTTPATLVEKSFDERLHPASAYAVYQLPTNIKMGDIRVARNSVGGKWKISITAGGSGRTDKKAVSFDDDLSLFQAKTVTYEQLAAKYPSEDIKMLLGWK